MLIVLVVLALAFQVLTDGLFATPRNLSNLARQASLTAILSAGMVAVIVAGHIDLSAGSAVGLVTVVAAWLQVEAGQTAIVAVVVAIVVGLALGAWQGAWVAYGRVPSFVVTLGGLLIFRGIALVITEGVTLSPLDPAFVELGQGFLAPETTLVLAAIVSVVAVAAIVASRRARVRHGLPIPSRRSAIVRVAALFVVIAAIAASAWLYRGIPYPVLIMIVVGVLLALMMRRTTFGRRLYAIGGNAEAARLSGIDVRRHTFLVFLLMGLLYGIVGILLAARLNSGPPNAGTFMELDAIAAAVIGGTSLLGGVGTVEGALVGAFLMASISNGMSLLNVLTWWQQIVTGLLLMGAVLIDIHSKRRAH
jgi:D-xylose transport system permease protein